MLKIGTRVKFRTTTDKGIITENLGDGMVMVRLDDDMTIPAFEEDLLMEEVWSPNINPPTDTVASYISVHNPVLPKPPKVDEVTDTGIHLVFEPHLASDGSIEQLAVWLRNDSNKVVLFDVDFVVFDVVDWSAEGQLSSGAYYFLSSLPFDTINDSPELDYQIKVISTEGVHDNDFKTLKIKTKQFLKQAFFSNHFNKTVYQFTLLNDFNTDKKNAASDLDDYTQKVLKQRKNKAFQKDNTYSTPIDPVPNVSEYAAFVPEIDLHIEMLHHNPSRLTPAEIVQCQIKAFETFLEKAVRLNVPRIFIIHGIGTGKLKNMVTARLRRHPYVLTFKNQYHERYGWGATEVWLSLN